MLSNKQFGEYLAQRPEDHEFVFALAPAEIKAAIATARDEAYETSLADAEQGISKQEIDIAEHAFAAAEIAAIRNNTELPSDMPVKRAKAQASFAVEDYVKKNSKFYASSVRLGQLIADEDARTKWLENITTSIEKDKAKLAKLLPEVAAITARLELAVAYTHFIGSFPDADNLQMNNINYSVQALNEAMNVRPWTKPTPAPEAKFAK